MVIKRKAPGKAGRPATIPFDEDIAVLARLRLQYQASQDQRDLALVAMAQRVLHERAKRNAKVKRTTALLDQIKRIMTDDEYCQHMAGTECVTLRHKFQLYRQAGLV